MPPDEEDKVEAYKTFAHDVLNRTLNLNVEFMWVFYFKELIFIVFNYFYNKNLVTMV